MEKEERRREHEAMMEELSRICNDDTYEHRNLEIREVEGGKGYCVFATAPISFGSPVCEYKGTYVSRKVAKSVAQCYVFDFTHDNRDSWAVYFPFPGFPKPCMSKGDVYR